MDMTCKIVAVLIKDRVQQIMEETLGDYQAGFRKAKSVIDHYTDRYKRRVKSTEWHYMQSSLTSLKHTTVQAERNYINV